MKKSVSFIMSILLGSAFVFTGCQNFLTGYDLKTDLDKAISYASAKPFNIKIETPSKTGKILPDGYRSSKISDSFEIEFTLSEGYEFENFVAVDSINKTILGSDFIKFENLKQNFNTYKVTATVLKELEGIVIKPVCRKTNDDIKPKFVGDLLLSSSRENFNAGKYISPDDFSEWTTEGTDNQYYKNHASHLYISINAYEEDSDLSLYITETIIKDINGNDVNKKSSKILTGIFNTSDYENYNVEIPYAFSSAQDGLVKLEFTLNDGSNFSETKTVYCIKDTVLDLSINGIYFYNETCEATAGVAERNQAVRNVMMDVPAFSENWFKDSSITYSSKPRLYFSYGLDSENLYDTVEIPYSGSAQTLEFKNYLNAIPEDKDTYIELLLKDDCDNYKKLSGIIYAKPEPAGYTVHKSKLLEYHTVTLTNIKSERFLYLSNDKEGSLIFNLKNSEGDDTSSEIKFESMFPRELKYSDEAPSGLFMCAQYLFDSSDLYEAGNKKYLKGFISSPISIKKDGERNKDTGYLDIMDNSIKLPSISSFNQVSDGAGTGTYTYSLTLSSPADFKTYDHLYFVNISKAWDNELNFCVPFEKNSLKAEISTDFIIEDEDSQAKFALIATKDNGDFYRIDFTTDDYGFNKQKEYNNKPIVSPDIWNIDNTNQTIRISVGFDSTDHLEMEKEYEYTMNLYYKMVEPEWDTINRPVEEIKTWQSFEPRKYTFKYYEYDEDACIYDPGWYCNNLEYCFKDLNDGDYAIAAETEDHLGNRTCKVIFVLSKKYVPKLELESYTQNLITFTAVKPDKSHSDYNYKLYIFNTNESIWNERDMGLTSSLPAERSKQEKCQLQLSRTNGDSYSIYKMPASTKDCFIKVYLDNYKYWGDTYDIKQELNIPVPMYYYIPDGVTYTDVNCEVKNYIEAANGYIIYCDRPAYVHTICSKINYKNDADKWEKMCLDEQKVQPKVIKPSSGIGQYTVESKDIPSGNFYVSIIHFADGDTLVTPVKYKN